MLTIKYYFYREMHNNYCRLLNFMTDGTFSRDAPQNYNVVNITIDIVIKHVKVNKSYLDRSHKRIILVTDIPYLYDLSLNSFDKCCEKKMLSVNQDYLSLIFQNIYPSRLSRLKSKCDNFIICDISIQLCTNVLNCIRCDFQVFQMDSQQESRYTNMYADKLERLRAETGNLMTTGGT
jgi:hypothetical protein